MARPSDPAALVEALRGGDRRSLARALSLVEQGGDAARQIGTLAHPLAGDAYTVGMTGAPGAGKSTITSGIIGTVRGRGDTLAILAIDPSSPFTGGAILGDRVRMQDHALDEGVFIRSMATRGHLGGLALATPQAIRVLAATGVPWIVLETVGVGQVEVEVAGAADTTIVVVNPGWGDAVQANKAGLMEIADVFVINKADRPGAGETRRDLETMLDMTADSGVALSEGWRPPILDTVAAKGEGVTELWDAVLAHRAHLESTGGLVKRRSDRALDELRMIVARSLERRAYELTSGDDFAELHAEVVARRLDPYTAADRIIGGVDG